MYLSSQREGKITEVLLLSSSVSQIIEITHYRLISCCQKVSQNEITYVRVRTYVCMDNLLVFLKVPFLRGYNTGLYIHTRYLIWEIARLPYFFQVYLTILSHICVLIVYRPDLLELCRYNNQVFRHSNLSKWSLWKLNH